MPSLHSPSDQADLWGLPDAVPGVLRGPGGLDQTPQNPCGGDVGGHLPMQGCPAKGSDRGQVASKADGCTLTLPWPYLRALSPNFRGHWAQKAKAKRQLRAAWAWQAEAQGARRMDAQALVVALEFIPPDRRARDIDNLLAACKAGLDGLADVLGVDDSRWRITITKGQGVGGFVRVTVSPDTTEKGSA